MTATSFYETRSLYRGRVSAGAAGAGAFAPAVFWKLFICNQENGGFTEVDTQFTRSLHPRSENPNCAPGKGRGIGGWSDSI